MKRILEVRRGGGERRKERERESWTYSMHPRHNIDRNIKFTILIPSCQVVETFFEERRLQVLEEVHALKVGNGGGGDAPWGTAIGRTAASDEGGLLEGRVLRGRESEGGGCQESEACGDGVHCCGGELERLAWSWIDLCRCTNEIQEIDRGIVKKQNKGNGWRWYEEMKVGR